MRGRLLLSIHRKVCYLWGETLIIVLPAINTLSISSTYRYALPVHLMLTTLPILHTRIPHHRMLKDDRVRAAPERSLFASRDMSDKIDRR